jgi:hypothetical protein
LYRIKRGGRKPKKKKKKALNTKKNQNTGKRMQQPSPYHDQWRMAPWNQGANGMERRELQRKKERENMLLMLMIMLT